MNVGDLKHFLSDKPEDMLIGLLDETTDDFVAANYAITNENLLIEDYVAEEGGEILGKMLFITFENKLNEDPI